MTASMPGMIGTWSPGGASTQTKATPWSENQPSVCSTRSSRTQQPVAQLDRDAVRGERLDEPVELAELVLVGPEGGRELDQEGAELAGLESAARPRRAAARPAPARAPGVSRTRPRSLVSTSSRMSGGSESSCGGVARERAVGLDVEAEAVGRDLDPAARPCALGDRVEARVELDPLEALRVPAQAVAGGHPVRVPLLDEAGVRPARGADEDATCHPWTVAARVAARRGRLYAGAR